MLADYAVRVEKSRGRRHPEAQHPYRNDFERDRDRIIHARAFRRLEAKTQVFSRGYSDHFRNRLTHTIEVAQISRTIAEQLGLNVDLVETLALAHDIGHPPFGHAGEKALNSMMQRHGFIFDHNLHALRIVEDFELRYAAFRGLNLTFEVREGIIKHSHDYSAEEYPELSEYLLDSRPPLEAQLIDWTDEIAYTIADLDDGYEARLLTLDLVRGHVPHFNDFYSAAEETWPEVVEKLKFNEALRHLLNTFVTVLIENTRERLRAAAVHSVEDVRIFPKRIVGFDAAVEKDRSTTKEFLFKNLYLHPAFEPEKNNAERIIGELFEFWMEHPTKLPASYQEKATEEPLPRIICDYIAGMTDPYIHEQYEKYCA
jgi:dGTPase